jgi:hypothetical protein
MTIPVTIIAIAARLSQGIRRTEKLTLAERGQPHRIGQGWLTASSSPGSASITPLAQ